MRHIAKALAAQGRGPDTELLHVTPNELKHLAGLAGLKELPRNPKTGLHEAGLFESILPIVGGIGGGLIAGPWGAALGSGLGTGLAGGSNQDVLRNAAIGGIGAGLMGTQGALTAAEAPAAAAPALSGASTAEAMGQAAATTPGTGMGALNSFANVPSAAAPLQALPAGGMTYTGEVPPLNLAGAQPAASPSMWSRVGDWAKANPMQAGIMGLTAYNALSQPTMQAPQKHQVEMKGQALANRQYTGGIPAVGANPYAERNYFADNTPYSYTQAPSTYEMRYAEGGQVQGYADGGDVQPQGYQHTQFQSAYQPGLNTQVAPGTVSPAMQAAFQQPAAQPSTAQPAAPTGGSGLAGLLSGLSPSSGRVAPAAVNYADPNWYANAIAQSEAANPTPAAAPLTWYQQRDPASARSGGRSGTDPTGLGRAAQLGLAMPTGGLSMLPGGQRIGNALSDFSSSLGFAKGGKLNLRAPTKRMDPMFLKGAGDGMSDSIPAYIDGGGIRPHEPIRVADSEYVIPADAVSHLGNGSSDAGAKQLDAMVARVRKARTGKKAQAPAINAQKYLPK